MNVALGLQQIALHLLHVHWSDLHFELWPAGVQAKGWRSLGIPER